MFAGKIKVVLSEISNEIKTLQGIEQSLILNRDLLKGDPDYQQSLAATRSRINSHERLYNALARHLQTFLQEVDSGFEPTPTVLVRGELEVSDR